MTRRSRRRHVVIVVQNLPVPKDRRVWREAQSLRDAGFRVTVVCPAGEGAPAGESELDGIHVHRFGLPRTGAGQVGFLLETAWSMLSTARLLLVIARREGIDVLQVCNPPETYFPFGWAVHLTGGAFVFDHHDPSPELYESRFARPRPLLRRALLLAERATLRTSDHVVTTSEGLRQLALTRGGQPADRVTVVRNGPDVEHMRRGDIDRELRAGREHLVVYVGVLAPQDGVEDLLHAVAHYVHELGRDDCTFAVVGSGSAEPSLRALVASLRLEDHVRMPGWLDDAQLFRYLSTAAVGVCPEPATPANLCSAMIKTTEYMAFGLPVLATDLPEAHASAGCAALYVPPSDPQALAKALARLLDDPALRRALGQAGRARVEGGLGWDAQARGYVRVFEDLVAAS